MITARVWERLARNSIISYDIDYFGAPALTERKKITQSLPIKVLDLLESENFIKFKPFLRVVISFNSSEESKHTHAP